MVFAFLLLLLPSCALLLLEPKESVEEWLAEQEPVESRSPYDIELVFVEFPDEYKPMMERATAVWEAAIIEDLEDVEVRVSGFREHFGPILIDGVVDDLRVYVTAAKLKKGWLSYKMGTGQVAVARPNGLPVVGFVVLSKELLKNGDHDETFAAMIHELGHTLGIGVGWWEKLVDWPDPRFMGEGATKAFHEAGGRYSLEGVPVQKGKASHWRESVLKDELMTPEIGGRNPLSAITIQALSDLGYRVDISRADTYRIKSGKPASMWVCGLN